VAEKEEKKAEKTGKRVMSQDWWVYIIRTVDDKLYTGITTNPERRYNEHCSGCKKGAKYLRAHPPKTLEFCCKAGGHSEALKMEYAIKQLPRIDKEAVIKSKISVSWGGLMVSKHNKFLREEYTARINKVIDYIETVVNVEDWPDMPVAYVRHVGPYKGDAELFGRLYGKLMGWAGPRDLLKDPDMKMFNVYHDNPEITDAENLRISICLTIPAGTAVDGEIGKMIIAGGRYAVGRFEIDVDQYQAAWNTMYSGWLPESGYQPADGPCMEQSLNNPAEHPEGKHIINICIPVKPL